ncbi:hypothetical protein D3C72_2376250 [compost metagenome]
MHAGPPLMKERRTAQLAAHLPCQEQQRKTEEQQRHASEHDVKKALHLDFDLFASRVKMAPNFSTPTFKASCSR